MKQVDIRTRTVPNRPRSGNYPTGSTVSVGGGGSSSTIINEGGGMDLAEARKHFLSRTNDDTAAGIINFSKGLRILSDLINKLFKENTEGDMSDESIMTSLRVLKEIADNNDKLKELFLRKDQEDTTNYLINLLGGAVFGKNGFAGGLAGYGARIDEQGNGEMRGLTLWEWLQVPELRYNRVEVFLGIKWNVAGAGIILSCTPDKDSTGKLLNTGTCTLKLESGELGAVDVDDISFGIYHTGTSSDATGDSDDGKGNFTFAGFSTCYFRITGVSGKSNDTFTYSLRPGYAIHPQPQMHFACYGNFTNTARQTTKYETRTYTRLLKNQNTWEIGAQNIAMQYGDLSNLKTLGLNVDPGKYSMYLNSVYFTGEIVQMKPDGTPIRTANDRGAWSEEEHYDYYDRVSYNGRIWLCVNEDGTGTAPAKGNADWLLQVEKGDKGDKGDKGIKGDSGTDGKPSYLHIAYANSSDGSSGFSVSDSTNKLYIGQYTDFLPDDSTDPKKYSWSKIKGDKGDKGDSGKDGTSVSNSGEWYDGLSVPLMSVVKMGGTVFLSKKATKNPPMWTLVDNKGRRLKTEQGYILTGEVNTEEYEVLVTDGEQGLQGLQGCVMRDSEWMSGVEYRNDSAVTDGSLPVRYIDIVLVRNDAVETGWDAYQCLKTHVSSSSITYTNTMYWKKFAANVGAIFTSLIIAKNAKIKFLQGNQLLILKSDGTITAGLSGSDSGGKIRFWAGSTTPDNAPFRVNEFGKMIATDADITGKITATSGTFKNVTFKTKDTGERIEISSDKNTIEFLGNDNIAYMSFYFYSSNNSRGSRFNMNDLRGRLTTIAPGSINTVFYNDNGLVVDERGEYQITQTSYFQIYHKTKDRAVVISPNSLQFNEGSTIYKGYTGVYSLDFVGGTKIRLYFKNGICYKVEK